MKRSLLILLLLISAYLLLAQNPSATLSIPYVNIADVAIGENIHISIVVDDITCLVDAFQVNFSYNEDIINWNGLFPVGDSGVSYIHPELTPLGPDWLWQIIAPGQLIFSWVEPTFYNPIEISPGDTLITLVYTYLGGLSPGQSSPVEFKEGTGISIVPPENLTLINGLIYNGLISGTKSTKEHISIWSNNNKVNIQLVEKNCNVFIYNLQGQILTQGQLKQGVNEIDVSEKNTCIIVKICSSDNFISKKLFIK